jgi:hypothetical protein
VRNGYKCQVIQEAHRVFTRCANKLIPKYQTGAFNFKGAKVVKKFERQGQQCEVYVNGIERLVKCEWKGAFQGATVIRRFNNGPNRCTVWRKGLINRTVCWNNRLITVKKFEQNGKKCILYRRLNRDYVRCLGQKLAH